MKSLTLAAIIALSAATVLPGTTMAQPADPAAEKVKQVIVYGDDPCPTSGGEEITVCARLAEKERYRIPPELRTDPNDPKVQSWLNRAQSIEYVGRTGTPNSCSPVGSNGFNGCFTQMARAAKEERRTLMGDASWADMVSAEREKRLSTIDAESNAIEARVKAQEAADAARAAPAPAPRP